MNRVKLALCITSGLVSLFAATALAAAPSDKDLVLRYTFDDIKGEKVIDASGHKLDGEITGPVAQVAGVFGKALSFDGEDNYVLMPETTLNKLEEFSVSVWAKIDERRPWARAWDFGSGSANNIFLAPVSGSQSVMTELKPDAANLVAQNSPQFDVQSWHHTVVTVKGPTIKLYVDGRMVSYNTYDEKPSYEPLWNAEQNYLGKSQYADPMFKGQLDEFRVYNRALTDDEVSSLAKK